MLVAVEALTSGGLLSGAVVSRANDSSERVFVPTSSRFNFIV